MSNKTLMDAVLSSDYSAMRKAIAAGGKVNEFDDGMTPLLFAIFRGDIEACRLLLESGADPNLSRNRCDSPLWHAEDDFGFPEIAELLKAYGAIK
jgi:ankyrin repeat protein